MTPEQRAINVYGRVLSAVGNGGSSAQIQIIADAIAQAVAAEREAIAKMVEDEPNSCKTCGLGGPPDWRAKWIAEKIRKRGEK